MEKEKTLFPCFDTILLSKQGILPASRKRQGQTYTINFHKVSNKGAFNF